VHKWGQTKGCTQAELAELEGGRYEALYGDGWYDQVKTTLGKGDHGLICVTDLMDHAIEQGDKLFAGTAYHDSWWLFHDALSAWWEKEAQEYLEERGFRDLQLRAWGDTNADYHRYHESLVGNRPEMMPLDTHFFFDLADACDKNIAHTSSCKMGPSDDPCKHGRYGAGTPIHLSHSLCLTWADYPSSERIVEDIQRLPLTIEQIIAHNGCLVPEAAIHKKGCSRTKRKGQPAVRLSSAVSEVVRQRTAELKGQAKQLAVGSK
jgi:hypothetical protein